MDNLKIVGLFPNWRKENLLKTSQDLVQWFEDNNYTVLLSKNAAEFLNMPQRSQTWDYLCQKIDIAVSLGGDGTLLNVARHMAPCSIPILGINMGHLGFLTEIELSDLYSDLEGLKGKDYFIDTRMMLEAEVLRDGKSLKKLLALNDVVVTKGPFARLIRLKTYANDAYIDTYPADGLIISTPTGSTAYSLSAGGPIINPNMELLLLTPICPHTLQSRSIVLSKDDIIKVKVMADHPEVMLTVDGQQGFELLPGDEIYIKRSSYLTKLIRLKQRSFYDLMRKKLAE